MENLKMKFKLHGLEFEIEGNEAVVKEEFANFRSFITGELLSKVNIVSPSTATISAPERKTNYLETAEVEDVVDEEYPVLKEVVKRDLPSTEVNWVLIYCFYASQFGKNPFTVKDISSLYVETGRKTKNRSVKMSNNLTSLLNKGFIKVHNDDEYLLKLSGVEFAKKILSGNAPTKSAKGASKITKSNGKPTKSKLISIEKFDIHKDSKSISLEDFLQEKNPGKSTANVIVVIGYYITHIKGLKSFSEGNIDYAYRTLSIPKRPNHLRQIIINAKNNNDFFESNEDGTWRLSRTGQLFVEEKLPRKN